jgi:hypothetical protein
MTDPDREYPDGERGREKTSEYISRAAHQKGFTRSE